MMHHWKQTHPNSCGAAALMVVFSENGLGGLSAEREMSIWKESRATQGEPGSLPGLIAIRALREGLDSIVWLDDSRLDQSKLALSHRAAFDVPTLIEEHVRGMAEADKAGISIRHEKIDPDSILVLLKDGSHLLVAVAVEASDGRVNLHWLLVRQKSGNLWIMDPANGENECRPEDGLRRLLLGPSFTGVAVRILPKQ